MKIIIDSAIPYVKGVLEPFFDVIYMAGSEMNNNNIADCDAMFIRTRTVCDEKLLRNSRVRFIGTATIGTDHIDMDYCHKMNIIVTNAAGCNAGAVAQWVCAAIIEQDKTTPIVPNKTTIGVVGVGNVGRVVADLFEQMGFIVLRNDPPRAILEQDFNSDTLDELLKRSDFITFHTPLTKNGKHPSYHLLNSENIMKLNPNATVINAARGSVVDEKCLLEAYDRGELNNFMIDVWENEPHICKKILEKGIITTAHIAGYSAQGKANGTSMIIREIAKLFEIISLIDWYPTEVKMQSNIMNKKWSDIKQLMKQSYDITIDSNALKNDATKFEMLRDNYNYRDECF